MFENMLRELGRLDGTKVSIKIDADEEGYLDKECPSETCQFTFKVREIRGWFSSISQLIESV
jgi:hypothetical protein